MKKILGLLLCINCMLLWSQKLVAEDGEGSIEPDLKPGGRPKIPAKSQFTFYTEGDELVIESTCRALADISIIDAITGEIVFWSYSYICPEYRCDISDLAGTFSLNVSINGQSTSVIICL